MKTIFSALLILCIIFQNFAQNEKIPVLLFTGGHDFDRKAFFEMLNSFENLDFTEVKHPDANNFWLEKSEYKIILFYDMVQVISPEQMEGFNRKVNEGIGMVFLHHALPSYKGWENYHQVLGGKYVEPSTNPENHSDYRHDVHFNLKILNPKHPIMNGISEFDVFDEIYINAPVSNDVIKLAGTDNPDSMNPLVWCQDISLQTRTVYIQPGHGPQVFSQPQYRKLLLQSLLWAGFKE
jgi:uncharacterized protein